MAKKGQRINREIIPDKMSSEQFQALMKKGTIESTKRGIRQATIFEESDITDITPVMDEPQTKYDILASPRLHDDGYYNMEMLNALKQTTNIFIPGECFSSKNSKQIRHRYTNQSDCCGADTTGKGKDRICLQCKKHCKPKTIPFIDSSDASKKYFEQMLPTYNDRRSKFLSMIENHKAPLYIGLFFSRLTRREFDYNNMSQAIMDIMQAAEWIPQDCMNVVTPVFLGYIVNKNAPGVIITVLHGDVYHDALIQSLTTKVP